MAACSPLVSFRFSFPSVLDLNPLVSIPRPLEISSSRRSTRSSAITTFIRQVFRTTDRRRTETKRCKPRPVERISRIVPIRDKEGGWKRRDRVAWGKGQGAASVFQWSRTRRSPREGRRGTGRGKREADRACKSRVYRARPITTSSFLMKRSVFPLRYPLYLRNKPDLSRFIALSIDRVVSEEENRRGSTHRMEEEREDRN